MSETTVTVETKMDITDAFVKECCPDDDDRKYYLDHTDIDFLVDYLIAAEPATSTSAWAMRDFRAISDSPWEIINVESGEHGPRLILERRFE